MDTEVIDKIYCDRIYDYRLAIRTMDAMWSDIAEDGAEQYKPDLIGEYWLGLYKDGEYLGMYRIHQLTSVLWQGHAFMLPDKRECSFDAGMAIMDYVLDAIPSLQKMIIEIPECFPNVLGFGKKLGFKEQGYNSKSYIKNGLVGVYQLGMERDDMIDKVKSWQQQQQ